MVRYRLKGDRCSRSQVGGEISYGAIPCPGLRQEFQRVPNPVPVPVPVRPHGDGTQRQKVKQASMETKGKLNE